MTTESQCTIDGCDKPLVAKGLCGMHYRRKRVNGDPLLVKRVVDAPTGCTVPGCEGEYYAKGMCTRHYSRMRRTGSIEPTYRSECEVSGCGGKHRGRGYCDKHLYRYKRYGDPMGERKPTPCPIPGCRALHEAAGYCAKHYQRLKKFGTVDDPPNRGSFAERQIFEFVKTIAPQAVQSDRSIIKPYELDIYIPPHSC